MDPLLDKRIAIFRNLHMGTERGHAVGDLVIQGDVSNFNGIGVDWIPYKAGVNHLGVNHENHKGLCKLIKGLVCLQSNGELEDDTLPTMIVLGEDRRVLRGRVGGAACLGGETWGVHCAITMPPVPR